MADEDAPDNTRAGFIRLNPDAEVDPDENSPGQLYEWIRKNRGESGTIGGEFNALRGAAMGEPRVLTPELIDKYDPMLEAVRRSQAKQRAAQEKHDRELEAAEQKRLTERAEDHALAHAQIKAANEQTEIARKEAEAERERRKTDARHSRRAIRVAVFAAIISVLTLLATLIG